MLLSIFGSLERAESYRTVAVRSDAIRHSVNAPLRVEVAVAWLPVVMRWSQPMMEAGLR